VIFILLAFFWFLNSITIIGNIIPQHDRTCSSKITNFGNFGCATLFTCPATPDEAKGYVITPFPNMIGYECESWPLPRFLLTKKAIVDVCYENDQYCFKWCFISALKNVNRPQIFSACYYIDISLQINRLSDEIKLDLKYNAQ